MRNIAFIGQQDLSEYLTGVIHLKKDHWRLSRLDRNNPTQDFDHFELLIFQMISQEDFILINMLIRDHSYFPKVIVLDQSRDLRKAVSLVKKGIESIVNEDIRPLEILQCVQTVLEGRFFYQDEYLRAILNEFSLSLN